MEGPGHGPALGECFVRCSWTKLRLGGEGRAPGGQQPSWEERADLLPCARGEIRLLRGV